MFVTFRHSLRLEQARRAEKVGDFQIALRAGIASELTSLEVADLDEHLDQVHARYAWQLAMYRDYLEMLNELHELARNAARRCMLQWLGMFSRPAEARPCGQLQTSAASWWVGAWPSVLSCAQHVPFPTDFQT